MQVTVACLHWHMPQWLHGVDPQTQAYDQENMRTHDLSRLKSQKMDRTGSTRIMKKKKKNEMKLKLLPIWRLKFRTKVGQIKKDSFVF